MKLVKHIFMFGFIFHNVKGEFKVDWAKDDPNALSGKLNEAVVGAVALVTDVKVLCAPMLQGEYNYSNGNDLDVKVQLDHARLENIKDFKLTTNFHRDDSNIKFIVDIAGATLTAKYKLEGKYYGEEGKKAEGTVTKNFDALHVEFKTDFTIPDGKLKIVAFLASAYSAQKAETIWNLEPDKGFNLFVSSIEKGFPRSDGIDLLNKIVANSIGAEGKDFDINYVFRIKDKSAGDKC